MGVPFLMELNKGGQNLGTRNKIPALGDRVYYKINKSDNIKGRIDSSDVFVYCAIYNLEMYLEIIRWS